MYKTCFKILLLLTVFVTISTCIKIDTPIDIGSGDTQKCIFTDDGGKTIDLTPLQNIEYSYFDQYSLSEYHYGICSPSTHCQDILNTEVEVESCGIFETNGAPNVTYAIGLFAGGTAQVFTEVTNLFYYQNVANNVCPGGKMIMQLELNCNYFYDFVVHAVLQPRTCHTIISIGTIHACEKNSLVKL
ncbi:hypothetical protein CYY_009883 [Polysphondylium violaceum]|uniref:MRH domain-containing protein n=1 Tax=Polysphondylium violaceum TaxID=133409 RepID=A0A8J4PKQ1_9MYCE|nr:hypothetical protein CYY_009883 [Polysphondylium violaceum]